MLDKSQIRNMRIANLTSMALRGCSLEEIRRKAYHLASPKTAEEYIQEVIRRLQK